MAMEVMHRIAVKLLTVFRWSRPACWHRPVVAMAKVEMMINVSVKMFRPMEPRSRPNEYAA
jgi:hypothetical protein